MAIALKQMPRDDEREEDLAIAYIASKHSMFEGKEGALSWIFDRMRYLRDYLPQKMWRVALFTWSMDQSSETMATLSSILEDLLFDHPEMISQIEAEAHRDATFATLLGEVYGNRLADDLYVRLKAASEQRTLVGITGKDYAGVSAPQPSGTHQVPHDDEKDEDLGRAFITKQHAEPNSDEHNTLFWTFERMCYLTEYLPHRAWRVILLIWSMDQSKKTMGSLSAGAIEDLLSKHGNEFIELVEVEARRDPSFAKLLGGVWQSNMSDEVWARLQAVWDRRGWDGIPE